MLIIGQVPAGIGDAQERGERKRESLVPSLLCFCRTTTTSLLHLPPPNSLSSLNTSNLDCCSTCYLIPLFLGLSLSAIPRFALRASSSSSYPRHRHRRDAFVSHHTLGSPKRRWHATKVRYFYFRVNYGSLDIRHSQLSTPPSCSRCQVLPNASTKRLFDHHIRL